MTVVKPETFYDLSPLDGTGTPFPFEQIRGKVVIIVNVASKCGFAPQFAELQNLYEEFKDQGLVIIGFPSSEFGEQEFDSYQEISLFCSSKFGVTFHILQKTRCNGRELSPVYEFLKDNCLERGILGFRNLRWNFEKFIIDRDGVVVKRFKSEVNPLSLKPLIERLLLST